MSYKMKNKYYTELRIFWQERKLLELHKNVMH